jgi:hypothetical protein
MSNFKRYVEEGREWRGKYPKTYHFSFSPNLQNDDRMLEDDNILVGKNVVVSEKLDGEGTGMTRIVCHARSLDSRDHPSRHWVKALHASVKQNIPEGWHFFGENLFAAHSIRYDKLPTYFFLFMIVNDKQMCLSWQDTKEWAELLGLQTVPVLYEGPWDIEKVQACYTGQCPWGEAQEGYVVRNAAMFPIKDFSLNMGKCVRYNHVQTGDFWMKNWVQNKLSK